MRIRDLWPPMVENLQDFQGVIAYRVVHIRTTAGSVVFVYEVGESTSVVKILTFRSKPGTLSVYVSHTVLCERVALAAATQEPREHVSIGIVRVP